MMILFSVSTSFPLSQGRVFTKKHDLCLSKRSFLTRIPTQNIYLRYFTEQGHLKDN